MRKKDYREEGRRYRIFLFVIGLLISLLVLAESWFQLRGPEFSLLALAHEAGFLKDFPLSNQPNKGIWHSVGWVGSFCFITMMLYSVRKRLAFMRDMGNLGTWLDTHIFLGLVGTVLILAHTTYRIGGIVSLSFWSMALVAVSGFIGRYIYIQIPRRASGEEVELSELNTRLEELKREIEKSFPGLLAEEKERDQDEEGTFSALKAIVFSNLADRQGLAQFRKEIEKNPDISREVKKELVALVEEEKRLKRSIHFFDRSRKLLHHWHVFHKPFAFIMFFVMFLHIVVYYFFRAGTGG